MQATLLPVILAMKTSASLFNQPLNLMLAVLLLIASPPLQSADNAKASAPNPPAPSAVDKRDELIKKAKEVPLTAEESFRLSLAQFELGQFNEALTVTQLALGTTKLPDEKAALLAVMAQCYGAKGDYKSAAAAALDGQRLNSRSLELAALRIAYFHEIGDTANELAAQDHYKRLLPDNSGDTKQVFDIVAGVRLVALIYEAVKVVYEIGKEEWPRVKPHVEKIAKELMVLWPTTVGRI